MSKKLKTHLICFDDHRWFSEEVRKRFSDTSRYTVVSFPTVEEIMHYLTESKDHNYCKVVILGAHDTKEQFEMIDRLTIEIRKTDIHTGLIILGPPEKMDEIRKIIIHNIDAYIPKNGNAVLRIHNAVKKLISEHSIGIFRKKRNISLYVLLSFIFLIAVITVIACYRFPLYF